MGQGQKAIFKFGIFPCRGGRDFLGAQRIAKLERRQSICSVLRKLASSLPEARCVRLDASFCWVAR